MSLFNFFRRKKKEPQDESETPSPEHQIFCDTAVTIFTPLLVEKGFSLTKTEVKKYFTGLTFRKGTQYIEINGSTFPTDYPYSYNIILGDGDSEDFFEHDWNSIALWRLKAKIEPTAKAREYDFPFENEIPNSLTHAKEELVKYGDAFLSGDLTLFNETRKSQNQDREPYRISYVDEDGNRQITHDEKSIEKKKKYS
jgi:hypothetical protein